MGFIMIFSYVYIFSFCLPPLPSLAPPLLMPILLITLLPLYLSLSAPQSFLRVADRRWTSYQRLHLWRKCFFFTQQPLTAWRSLGTGSLSWDCDRSCGCWCYEYWSSRSLCFPLLLPGHLDVNSFDPPRVSYQDMMLLCWSKGNRATQPLNETSYTLRLSKAFLSISCLAWIFFPPQKCECPTHYILKKATNKQTTTKWLLASGGWETEVGIRVTQEDRTVRLFYMIS